MNTTELITTPSGAQSPQWTEKLRDGSTVLIRPIGRQDVELERAFVERLSPQTRRWRFLGQLRELGAEQLHRFTDIDYARDMAFVALVHEGGEKREVGVSRYCVGADPKTCEYAVVVADSWQGRGLGTLLMRHLIDTARANGIRRLVSIDAAENSAMRELAEHLGFERHADPDDAGQVIHTITL